MYKYRLEGEVCVCVLYLALVLIMTLLLYHCCEMSALYKAQSSWFEHVNQEYTRSVRVYDRLWYRYSGYKSIIVHECHNDTFCSFPSECKRASDHGGRPVHRSASPLTSSDWPSAPVCLDTFSPGVPCPPGTSVTTKRTWSLVSQSLDFSPCTFHLPGFALGPRPLHPDYIYIHTYIE